MSEAFISYSRKDKAFVKKLHEAFSQENRDIWVDWEDIPLTADWRQEIYQGIDEANNFIFVISPDSVVSQVCSEELERAIKDNKRCNYSITTGGDRGRKAIALKERRSYL